MSVVIQHKNPKKTLLSSSQKTFTRLTKKVEKLQKETQKNRKILDDCLLFYCGQILPEKQTLAIALKEFVRVMYGYYKKIKSLSRKDRTNLKRLIVDKLNVIFNSIHHAEVDSDIHSIFEDLEGFSIEDILNERLNDWEKEAQMLFEEDELDFDPAESDPDLSDDEDESNRELIEALNEAMSNLNEEPFVKTKNKRALQKEQTLRELESMQKKGISTIYKELAKLFHPDLEQSHERKSEKEEWMKKLTCAYTNNDLYTLLSLKKEWMSHSGNLVKMHSEDQLKIYNSILKDQADRMQVELETVILDPKYLPIQLYSNGIVKDMFPFLTLVHRNLKKEVHRYQSVNKELQDAGGEQTLRSILHEISIQLSLRR